MKSRPWSRRACGCRPGPWPATSASNTPGRMRREGTSSAESNTRIRIPAANGTQKVFSRICFSSSSDWGRGNLKVPSIFPKRATHPHPDPTCFTNFPSWRHHDVGQNWACGGTTFVSRRTIGAKQSRRLRRSDATCPAKFRSHGHSGWFSYSEASLTGVPATHRGCPWITKSSSFDAALLPYPLDSSAGRMRGGRAGASCSCSCLFVLISPHPSRESSSESSELSLRPDEHQQTRPLLQELGSYERQSGREMGVRDSMQHRQEEVAVTFWCEEPQASSLACPAQVALAFRLYR